MGILCWNRTMIGYVRNIIIIIFLHVPIIWTKKAYLENCIGCSDGLLDDVTQGPVTAPAPAAPAAPAVSDFEMLELLHSLAGTTFPVSCIRDKDGLVPKKMTCGAGKMCSKDLCGPAEHPSIARPPVTLRPPGVRPPGGGERDCDSVNVPNAGPLAAMIQYWCNNLISDGLNCPALYGHFYLWNIDTGYCLDFCCNFVFSTCKCNCCKCLRGAGGTCIGKDCTSFSCPNIFNSKAELEKKLA